MSSSSISPTPYNSSPQNPGRASRRPRPLPATFRALRHRNYRLWFFGQTVSLIGTWMQVVAQQVLVYRLTGSAAALGMISFIGLIPILPLSLWGGSLSDRLPRRTIILAMQACQMIQAIVLAALAWTGAVQLWHVYLLALLLSAAVAIDLPARQAFTVDMIDGKEDLANAIGLNSAMFNAARAIGPALAGILVAAIGEGPAFLFNAFSFLAVIASLLMMRDLPTPAPQPAGQQSTLQHMAGGMRFVLRERLLLTLISLVAVSAFLSMPYNTLLPVFAGVILKDSAQPAVQALCGGERPLMSCQSPEALPLGLLYAMVGLGAVIGALTVASMQGQARRGLFLTAGNLAFPLLLLIFAASRSFTLSMLVMLFIGFSFVWQNALANTLLQVMTPDELRGRVMAVYTLTFQTMMRLGGLQAGYLADWLSAPLSIALGAGASLLYGLGIAVKVPGIRKL